MTTSTLRITPSFPPVDDALATIRRIDWQALASHAFTATITIVAILHVFCIRIQPHLASLLRSLAAKLDSTPSPTPSAPSLTVTQLRTMAREAGISRSFYNSARKAALIEALGL
jgi:hypothetical protein